jgi:hypothetical protein
MGIGMQDHIRKQSKKLNRFRDTSLSTPLARELAAAWARLLEYFVTDLLEPDLYLCLQQ